VRRSRGSRKRSEPASTTPAAEAAPLAKPPFEVPTDRRTDRAKYRSDVYDKTARLLIEAKGTVAREALRMAIGQLLDYRCFTPPETELAVLVPEKPRADLLALLESADVHAIWPEGGRFRASGLEAF
jgi:hypothetical protein